MFAECLAVGLDCGDQRRLTGSGSALEALRDDALYESTYFTFTFYRAMRCISAVVAVTQCPSVCPSVRPSRSWITSKRINISSKFFHHRVATPLMACTRNNLLKSIKNDIMLQCAKTAYLWRCSCGQRIWMSVDVDSSASDRTERTQQVESFHSTEPKYHLVSSYHDECLHIRHTTSDKGKCISIAPLL